MATAKTNSSHNEEFQKQLRMVRTLIDENYNDAYVSKVLREKGIDEEQIVKILHQAKVVLLTEKLKQSRIWLWFIGIVWVAILLLFIDASFVNETNDLSFFANYGLRIIVAGALLLAVLLTRHMIMWVKVAKMETIH